MAKYTLIALQLTRSLMGVVCFTSIILAGAENADGSVDFGWTLLWFVVALLSACGFGRLDDYCKNSKPE